MKRQVKDLIQQKGINVFACVDPKTSIYHALKILEITKSSTLLVIEKRRLKGIFSEKDFARAAVQKNISLSEAVDSIMTKKIFYAEPTFTLEECLQIMSKEHIWHLPIIEHSRPIALVSMRHTMEVLVEDKETQIRDLTSYITGRSSFADRDQNEKETVKMPIYYSCSNQEAL